MNFLELRQNGKTSFDQRYWFWEELGVISFKGGAQFEDVYAAATRELAARKFGSAGTIAADIEREVIAALITGFCPAAAPFAGIISGALVYIVNGLVSAIVSQFNDGLFGASPDEHAAYVQQLASEAAAA